VTGDGIVQSAVRARKVEILQDGQTVDPRHRDCEIRFRDGRSLHSGVRPRNVLAGGKQELGTLPWS